MDGLENENFFMLIKNIFSFNDDDSNRRCEIFLFMGLCFLRFSSFWRWLGFLRCFF